MEEANHKVYYVQKKHYNGFIETNLESVIRQTGVQGLLLVGSFAPYCVLSTAREAVEKGYYFLTSAQLLFDYQGDARNGSADWYQKRGVYFERYEDLLKFVEAE